MNAEYIACVDTTIYFISYRGGLVGCSRLCITIDLCIVTAFSL